MFATDAGQFETWQTSLFGLGPAALAGPLAAVDRLWLDDSSWVDYRPGWVVGADQLLADLVQVVAWRQRQVTMYGRRLDEPRLTAWWAMADPAGEPGFPSPVLHDLWAELCRYYGRPFDSLGANLYRHGADSVAWHSDRIGHATLEPVVAIVSLGARRPFLLRPKGGGPSTTLLPGDGDLIVMGGRCQHDWEHAVPKVAVVSGPRLSLMYRHASPELGEQEHARSGARNGYEPHRIVMQPQGPRRRPARH